MDFSLRSTDMELMDDPQLDRDAYEKAYNDINSCNQLLGGYQITIKQLKKLLQKDGKKSYTILDMGSGDGEMLRKIARAFQNTPIELQLIGIDLRNDVLELARRKSAGYDNISFRKQDILTLDKTVDCDILLCTLTMHHFTDEQIGIFLKKFTELARLGVIINDLERNFLAYQLFKLFSIFFIKTKIAHLDGLTSISKGFKKRDLASYAKALPEVNHYISWKWAFRYLWLMTPQTPNTL